MKSPLKYLIALALMVAGPVSAKTWTVLVYWAVDNDLYDFSVPYMQQFEQVGSNDQLRILTQIDYPDNRKDQRLLMQKGGVKVLEDLPKEMASSDPKTFENFLHWGLSNYPADQFLVVVGSHGMNWRGIVDDRNPKGTMSLEGMNNAIASMNRIRGKKLDMLLFDACRMSYLETLAAFKSQVNWILGSQQDVNGFEHVTPLSFLQKNPNADIEQLGQQYVRAYPKPFLGQKNNTVSLLRINEGLVSGLSKDLEMLAQGILNLDRSERQKIIQLLDVTANEYKDRAIDWLDLILATKEVTHEMDFLTNQLITLYSPASTETDANMSIQTGYSSNGLIVGNAFTNSSNTSSGLAVNCPTVLKNYRKSAFARAHPNWLKFCEQY